MMLIINILLPLTFLLASSLGANINCKYSVCSDSDSELLGDSQKMFEVLGLHPAFANLVCCQNEDFRNTLINLLRDNSNLGVPHLQGWTTGSIPNLKNQGCRARRHKQRLLSMAAITVQLLVRNIRTKDELKSMSYDDQRNTLIHELDIHNDFMNVSDLQAMGDFNLAYLACYARGG